jgi:DNA-directed RNA polymerase specialized sigma24 family protein
MDSDEKLVELYLAGDEKALDELIRRYAGHIYNFIYQYIRSPQEAEDLTQARNTVFDFLRKKKAQVMTDLGDDETGEYEAPDTGPLPEELFEKKENDLRARRIIAELPPIYQAVLSLYYLNDMNFREISEALGEPLDTVKARHRRAMLNLKKELNP